MKNQALIGVGFTMALALDRIVNGRWIFGLGYLVGLALFLICYFALRHADKITQDS